LAEETELILPMTLWVLREACSQLRTWRGRFPAFPELAVSVNMSGKAFSQEDMHEQIAGVLKETGVQGANVKLEITEGVLMDKDDGHTAVMLGRLKSMNLRLMIDDFGTGYSSLSYMHRLPIDILKIDRSFVSNMGLGEKNSEIVRTIKTLASNLGMKVVAEGVETAQQLASLRQLKCEYGQGFYFAKPLEPAKAEELLAADPRW
jgi:EAL domain-containing protein (putative c-di-GMP-specific phosphodiesterase class I)